MKRSTFTLAGLLALGLAVPAAFAADLSAVLSAVGSAKAEASAKAEPLPYGHKDPVPEQARYGAEGFVPTPQRPMNFRAGGNGWYPGATPPLGWREGTPVQVDRKGIFGNPPREGVAKVWDFADTKSRNILWKVPVTTAK